MEYEAINKIGVFKTTEKAIDSKCSSFRRVGTAVPRTIYAFIFI